MSETNTTTVGAANRFAVLLRGVNVGGNRRVPKAEFQAVLEGLGATNTVVYINSGNAVCTLPEGIGRETVQDALEAHFGFTIPTLVLPAAQIIEIAAAIPDHWGNDKPTSEKTGQKSDVLYLFDELDSPQVLDQIGYRPEIETMLYVPGAVIANVTRANQSRGSLQKLIGTKLYRSMTVRNVNTARKLAELVTKK